MISSQSNIQVWNTYFSTRIFDMFKGFFEPICSDTSDSAEMSHVPLPVPSSFPVLVLRTIRSVPCPSMKFHRFSFFGVESRTMPYCCLFSFEVNLFHQHAINVPELVQAWIYMNGVFQWYKTRFARFFSRDWRSDKVVRDHLWGADFMSKQKYPWNSSSIYKPIYHTVVYVVVGASYPSDEITFLRAVQWHARGAELSPGQSCRVNCLAPFEGPGLEVGWVCFFWFLRGKPSRDMDESIWWY